MALGLDQVLGQANNLGEQVIFLLVLFALVFVFAIGFMYLMNYMKFNHEVWVWSRNKSGKQLRKLKGGHIRKKGNLEFRCYKPKYRVNNFDRDWVVMAKTGGLLKKFKPTIWAFQRTDNKIEQINPELYEDVKKGIKLIFQPRQLGKSDFEEEFDRHTESMFDIRDFFEKHGQLLAWGGVVFTLVLINLFVVTKFGQ